MCSQTLFDSLTHRNPKTIKIKIVCKKFLLVKKKKNWVNHSTRTRTIETKGGRPIFSISKDIYIYIYIWLSIFVQIY